MTSWRQLYWDDATAFKAKYDLVNQRGLRGVGLWALGYDGTRPDLYEAIVDKFIKDSVPADHQVGDPQRRPCSRPTATTGSRRRRRRCPRPGWSPGAGRSSRRSDSTAAAAVRTGKKTGTKPTFTWNGTDADGSKVPDGGYHLTLWTEDASHNRASHTFTVTVDTEGAGGHDDDGLRLPLTRG